MQIENQTVLKVSIDGRDYCLICSPDSPLGGLYDALCQMKNYVTGKIDEHQRVENKKEDKCSKED